MSQTNEQMQGMVDEAMIDFDLPAVEGKMGVRRDPSDNVCTACEG